MAQSYSNNNGLQSPFNPNLVSGTPNLVQPLSMQSTTPKTGTYTNRNVLGNVPFGQSPQNITPNATSTLSGSFSPSSQPVGSLGGASSAGYKPPQFYDPMTGKAMTPGQPLTPRAAGSQPLYDTATGKLLAQTQQQQVPIQQPNQPNQPPKPVDTNPLNQANPYKALLDQAQTDIGSYNRDLSAYNTTIGKIGANTSGGIPGAVLGGEAQNFQAQNQGLLSSEQNRVANDLALASGAAPTGNIINVSPITGQPVSGNLGSLASLAGQVSGAQQVGQQSVLNQAVINKVIPMAANLDNVIKTKNINPSDTTLINQIQNWGRTNIFSDPSIPEFQGQLNDIVTSLSGVLGVPSSATSDFRTQLAGAIANGLQNGQSISDSVNYFVQQAQQANAGYASGATSPIGGTQTGQSNYNF